MDAPKKARVLNRNRPAATSQSQRGDRQIVLPMTREQFDDCWNHPNKMRQLVDRSMAEHPELFPPPLLPSDKAMPFTASAGHPKNLTVCACERFARSMVPTLITCGHALS